MNNRYLRYMKRRATALDRAEEAIDNNCFWRRYYKYDRRLYRIDQRRFQKQLKTALKKWHPYDAFMAIPEMLCLMVERCYQYWMRGFNVHSADEYRLATLRSLQHAYALVEEYRIAARRGDIVDEDCVEQAYKLFAYVGAHYDEWWD